MKRWKEKKITRFMMGLAIVMLILTAAPYQLEARVCERALQSCLVDAVITSFFGGPGAGGAWATGCSIGYAWCLRYID
jgi:hypothetical protein